MNKRLFSWAIVALFIAAAVFSFHLYFKPKDYEAPPTDEEIQQTLNHLQQKPGRVVDVARPLDPSHAVRVAIGSLGLPDENQNRDLANLVAANLTGSREVELVERQDLDAALEEAHLSLSGLVRASDAIRVGKLLRADWFLLGSSTRIEGTNCIIVRIVDARTGILQDGCGLAIEQSSLEISKRLADFVRRCRQLATTGSPRIYLAVGTFEDLSPNSHAAALPQELRSYLTSAYQSSSVTLLEREFVSVLLNEVNLDLAGLAENGGTNVSSPMQAAYWIVDGYYQSYDTTNSQVELMLGVQRIFGRRREVSLQNQPGEPLFRQAKASVDKIMQQDSSPITLSRMTEVKAQMADGKRLARLENNTPIGDLANYVYMQYEDPPRNEWIRRRHNTEEAMRAFQTVLLLDPTNREARLCIASCLRRGYIQRNDDEARNIYREIIESGVHDHWDNIARQALIASFDQWHETDLKRNWFENAAKTTSSTTVAEFYREQLKGASEQSILEKKGTTAAEGLAEKRLFDDIKAWNQRSESHGFTVDFYNTGLGKYVDSFGTNSSEAARNLIKLLPGLQATSPKLTPYLLAGVTSFQVDTNAAIISEFSDSLAQYTLHPERLAWPDYYFQLVSHPLGYWCTDHKLYALKAQLLEARRAAAAKGYAEPLDDEDTISLGYAYMNSEQWQKALTLFDSFSNRPVEMNQNGDWGTAFLEVLPGKKAALCREKLGLPAKHSSFDLELDPQTLHFDSSFAFTCDNAGLWLASGNQLSHLNFNLQTNLTFSFPFSGLVTAICVGPSNVWVGTSDAGILEFDKATRRFQRFTESNGLRMNAITRLRLDGHTLWIGYGNQQSGGFGQMDIKSHSVISFTPSLTKNPSQICQPPGAAVADLFVSMNGDPWLTAGGTTYHYFAASNSWETVLVSGVIGAISLDHDQLVAALRKTVPATEVQLTSIQADGRTSGVTNVVVPNEELMRFYETIKTNRTQKISLTSNASRLISTLETYSLQTRRWETKIPLEALPHPPSTLARDGDEIWAGGEGFIAALDAITGKTNKICYLPCRRVDHVEKADGFVWASFNGDTLSSFKGELYRAALTN